MVSQVGFRSPGPSTAHTTAPRSSANDNEWCLACEDLQRNAVLRDSVGAHGAVARREVEAGATGGSNSTWASARCCECRFGARLVHLFWPNQAQWAAV
jgi:hypothetical protein